MVTITISAEDANSVLGAITTAAEDWAYRADYERSTCGDEEAEFQQQADELSALHERFAAAITPQEDHG